MSPRAAAGVVVAAALALAASRVLFPYDLGQYEGGLWAPAELLVSGKNPYHVRLGLEPPYLMAPYGPVYYALVGVGVKLFGPQFWFGRLVSVIAVLAAALGLARLARRGSGWDDAGWIAAALFLASVPAQWWIATQRPDAVALALAVWALVLATEGGRRGGSGAESRGDAGEASAVVGAAVAASVAALTRQTELAPLAIVPVWYALRGAWRDAARFVAVAIVVLGTVTFVLESTSDGGYLWQQLVLASGVARSGEQLGLVLGRLAAAPATWIAAIAAVVGLPAAITALRRRHAARPDEQIVTLAAGWLGAATVVAALTSGRAGSNVNYWLEPAAAAALLGTLGIAHVRTTAPRLPRVVAVAAVLAAVVGTIGLAAPEARRWRDRPLFDAVVARLAALPNDAPYLSIYPELALYAGRTPWFNDPIQYDGRAPVHAEMLTALRRSGAFPAIVLNTPATFDAYREEPLDGGAPTADQPVHLFVPRMPR